MTLHLSDEPLSSGFLTVIHGFESWVRDSDSLCVKPLIFPMTLAFLDGFEQRFSFTALGSAVTRAIEQWKKQWILKS